MNRTYSPTPANVMHASIDERGRKGDIAITKHRMHMALSKPPMVDFGDSCPRYPLSDKQVHHNVDMTCMTRR